MKAKGIGFFSVIIIWNNIMVAIKYIFAKIALGLDLICETVWSWFMIIDNNFQNWVEVVMAMIGS